MDSMKTPATPSLNPSVAHRQRGVPQLLQHLDPIRCHSCSHRKSKAVSLLPSDLHICLSLHLHLSSGNRMSVLQCLFYTQTSSVLTDTLGGSARLYPAPSHMTPSRLPFGSCLILYILTVFSCHSFLCHSIYSTLVHSLLRLSHWTGGFTKTVSTFSWPIIKSSVAHH